MLLIFPLQVSGGYNSYPMRNLNGHGKAMYPDYEELKR